MTSFDVPKQQCKSNSQSHLAHICFTQTQHADHTLNTPEISHSFSAKEVPPHRLTMNLIQVKFNLEKDKQLQVESDETVRK